MSRNNALCRKTGNSYLDCPNRSTAPSLQPAKATSRQGACPPMFGSAMREEGAERAGRPGGGADGSGGRGGRPSFTLTPAGITGLHCTDPVSAHCPALTTGSTHLDGANRPSALSLQCARYHTPPDWPSALSLPPRHFLAMPSTLPICHCPCL